MTTAIRRLSDMTCGTCWPNASSQVACAYEDANGANALRTDPMFKLGLDQRPLDTDNDLAGAATFSRLENAASTKDIYRIAQAFVDQFIASYAAPPEAIILDMDHSEDGTHGQQELSFYNHHYRNDCYLPLRECRADGEVAAGLNPHRP